MHYLKEINSMKETWWQLIEKSGNLSIPKKISSYKIIKGLFRMSKARHLNLRGPLLLLQDFLMEQEKILLEINLKLKPNRRKGRNQSSQRHRLKELGGSQLSWETKRKKDFFIFLERDLGRYGYLSSLLRFFLHLSANSITISLTSSSSKSSLSPSS